MAPRPLILLLAIFLASAAFAQDTLFYTNGDTIIGQVEEVGKETIRYHTSSAGNQVAITVDKLELERVRLASGQSFVFNEGSGEKRSPRYVDRVNLISLDFMSPAVDHFTLGYERLLHPRMSLSVKVGYISLGIYSQANQTMKPKGVLLKAGVNFFLPPSQRRVRSGRTLHPLSGWYLGPEVIFNSWAQDRDAYYSYYPYGPYPVRDDRSSLCLDVVIGRKVMIGERLTFDFYGGVGYGLQWVNGLSTENSDQYTNPYASREQYGYSHLFVGNTPLILTAGLLFGYLF